MLARSWHAGDMDREGPAKTPAGQDGAAGLPAFPFQPAPYIYIGEKLGKRAQSLHLTV